MHFPGHSLKCPIESFCFDQKDNRKKGEGEWLFLGMYNKDFFPQSSPFQKLRKLIKYQSIFMRKAKLSKNLKLPHIRKEGGGINKCIKSYSINVML